MIRTTNRISIAMAAALTGAIGLMCVPGMANSQEYRHGDIRVTINGERVRFADIGPQEIDGRTMVPVRGVLEQLGADVGYNNATETVTARSETRNIRLRIGERWARVNGNRVRLDQPAQLINDHTFVPLRFLSEALGAKVAWHPNTQTVAITTGEGRPNGVRTRMENRGQHRDRDGQ